ncbi:hypothetical protein GLOTRDRAFT_92448 [Gloeophyllum trabeum ATCC 11539]|uniref:Myb-like domain-containing protein n=1 Tax=Gloeophyllum trabeum (strain ATCC 11539 / FP-39264 / Madison 617) TaxID=670483 RepID=S7QBS3_GLOTA|nr:uncharacterized protein GLOTRDRAFT_92448 [Gloeophyllum trabeum ATCC 11539]EPQ57411.1 hypothetical protein GLOTRDRAFT_92448 [Gloeophyllum trabeum ATCC 11539]
MPSLQSPGSVQVDIEGHLLDANSSDHMLSKEERHVNTTRAISQLDSVRNNIEESLQCLTTGVSPDTIWDAQDCLGCLHCCFNAVTHRTLRILKRKAGLCEWLKLLDGQLLELEALVPESTDLMTYICAFTLHGCQLKQDQECVLADIPSTVDTVVSKFKLDGHVTTYATCSECQAIYVPYIEEGSADAVYPATCASKMLGLLERHNIESLMDKGPFGSPVTGSDVRKRSWAHWTDAEDAIMVQVLKDKKEKGNQADNGWKRSVWIAMADALKAEGYADGVEKTASKCMDHWTNLKAAFVQVKRLRGPEVSDFGWDDGDEVWDWYIKSDGQVTMDRDDDMPASNVWTSSTSSAADSVKDRALDGQEGKQLEQVPKASHKWESNDEMPACLKAHCLRIRHQSGAEAMVEVADAIQCVAQAAQAQASGSAGDSGVLPLTSPQHRSAAIRKIEDDGDLAETDQVHAMRLFSKRTSVADTYLAISNRTIHTHFLQAEMDDLFGDSL